MTKQQFAQCVKLALTKDFETNFSDNTFNGIALDNKRRYATQWAVANQIVYHTFTFAGTIDNESLNEMREYCKRIDLID